MKKSRSIFFVADFFKNDLLGGAESNDSVLIEHLIKAGYEVNKVHAHDLKVEDLVSDSATFIVGNFITLSEEVKNAMANGKVNYIIYEHDHKYLKTRDPSVFPNFEVPSDQIINRLFYKNASAVVVLSEVCKKIIEKTLDIAHVYSIGTSLWSEGKFNMLEDLASEKKQKHTQYGVLNSENPIKGTSQSIKWCNNNNKEYELIGNSDEIVFLNQLRDCEKLVFIPQVLEAFCRLVAEAKMLNCKLVTTKALLGFASEECYNLSGKELISEMRARVEGALDLFESLIESSTSVKAESKDITAILTCYKRPQLLREQILSIKSQSAPASEVWVWINKSEENSGSTEKEFQEILDEHPAVKVFRNNHNWKFFGRFAAAMLAQTEYIVMYDDDTIPGEHWHRNCLDSMKRADGILGGVGCRLRGSVYRGHQRIGWSSPNEEMAEVDLVGHSWFFKREWMKYFWMEKPHTWENGEDIHFSYVAQKYGGIKTYVPPHPKDRSEMFSSLKGMEYGVDEVATSVSRNHEAFYKQRDECVQHAIKNGWQLVKDRVPQC